MNDKYIHYELEDFLSDDEFINSILDVDQQIKWQNWLAKRPDAAKAVNEAKSIVTAISFNEEEFKNKSKVWDRIDRATTAKEIELPSQNKRRNWIYIAFSAAASIALLFFVFTSDSSKTTHSNSDYVVEELSLPAGSTVSLYKDSELSYSGNSWSNQRKMNLKGKATFDVTKGVPFMVETTNGSVRVLGTKFTIINQAETFIVHVDHGKVEVKSGNTTQILTAGMNYQKNPIASIKEENFTLDNSAESYYQFENANLNEVLNAIEAEFSVKLIADESIKTLQYTGFFSNSKLDEALQTVLWPMGITYKINNTEIILTIE